MSSLSKPLRPHAGRLAVVLTVLGLATLGVVLTVRDGGSTQAVEPEPRTLAEYHEDIPLALRLAQEACGDFAAALSLIEQDARADDVLARLEDFESTALRAYSHDVRWLPLTSAAMALLAGMHHDDPDAALIGVREARRECARTL